MANESVALETASKETASATTAVKRNRFDWKRLIWLLVGVQLFAVVYYSPAWPDAVDPNGANFVLTREGKGALAVFLLAGTWWIFEVLPIGVTSLTIGVLQALFLLRPAKEAFNDFMDPSVMFIFASIVNGHVVTKTGLTKRMAYKKLAIVGLDLGRSPSEASLQRILQRIKTEAGIEHSFIGG